MLDSQGKLIKPGPAHECNDVLFEVSESFRTISTGGCRMREGVAFVRVNVRARALATRKGEDQYVAGNGTLVVDWFKFEKFSSVTPPIL